MSKIYVAPASGVPLPYPGGVLPPAGGWVAEDRFWRRRIVDRDVIETDPPQSADIEAPAETAEPSAAAELPAENDTPRPRATKK